MMRIKFLGTGSNGGVPQVDCRCENCEAALKKRGLVRRRPSLLVERDGIRIVLDCSPDFRQQMIEESLRLQDLGLIVITHGHFDHINGIMELSGGKQHQVPVLVSSGNALKLKQKEEIGYLIRSGFMKLISENEGRRLGIELVAVLHDENFPTDAVIISDGGRRVWYSPDVREITEEMLLKMREVDLIIFDGTFFDESSYPARKLGHIPMVDSVPILANLGKSVVFTHVNHSENVNEMRRFLKKSGFILASDGLVLNG